MKLTTTRARHADPAALPSDVVEVTIDPLAVPLLASRFAGEPSPIYAEVVRDLGREHGPMTGALVIGTAEVVR